MQQKDNTAHILLKSFLRIINPIFPSPIRRGTKGEVIIERWFKLKIIYFLLTIAATLNLIVVILSGLLGFNVYQKYGKQIAKFFFQFLFLLVVVLIAFAISGLSS